MFLQRLSSSTVSHHSAFSDVSWPKLLVSSSRSRRQSISLWSGLSHKLETKQSKNVMEVMTRLKESTWNQNYINILLHQSNLVQAKGQSWSIFIENNNNIHSFNSIITNDVCRTTYENCSFFFVPRQNKKLKNFHLFFLVLKLAICHEKTAPSTTSVFKGKREAIIIYLKYKFWSQIKCWGPQALSLACALKLFFKKNVQKHVNNQDRDTLFFKIFWNLSSTMCFKRDISRLWNLFSH